MEVVFIKLLYITVIAELTPFIYHRGPFMCCYSLFPFFTEDVIAVFKLNLNTIVIYVMSHYAINTREIADFHFSVKI